MEQRQSRAEEQRQRTDRHHHIRSIPLKLRNAGLRYWGLMRRAAVKDVSENSGCQPERAAANSERRKESIGEKPSAYLRNITIALFCFFGFTLLGRDAIRIARADASVVGQESKAPSEKLIPAAYLRGRFRASRNAGRWTKELIACATVGPRVKGFAEAFPGSPIEKVIGLYSKVSHEWLHQDDPDSDTDWFISADDLLRPGNFMGDCEDRAVLLASVLQAWNVTSRIVVTTPSKTYPGHVFTQVLIGKPGDDPKPVLNKMEHKWLRSPNWSANAPVQTDAEGTWLTLDGGSVPKDIADLGPREFLLYPDGRTVDLRN